jgi:hypothetical protein
VECADHALVYTVHGMVYRIDEIAINFIYR